MAPDDSLDMMAPVQMMDCGLGMKSFILEIIAIQAKIYTGLYLYYTFM